MMTEFYSHAKEKDDGIKVGSKLLKDHLCEVGNTVQRLLSQGPFNNLFIVPDIGFLIGIAHDFGKYTSFFQDYLLYDKKDNQLRHHHGFISAIFAAHLVAKCQEDKKEFNKYLPLLAYFVILHHHGDLRTLELDIIKTWQLKSKDFMSVDPDWRNRLLALNHQIDDISKNLFLIKAEYQELTRTALISNLSMEEFLNSYIDTLSMLHKLYYDLTNNECEETRLRYFMVALFLYSLLIDSDKKDAADIAGISRREIPGDLVDRFRQISPAIDTDSTIGITGIRNEIYLKAVKKASELNLSHHIFTLTAPTGTGKTLTSLSCALKLRERIGQKTSDVPRIIYSLPFTSIIDQNYEVIKDILSQLPDFNENESTYLIKHHHLEDLKYKIEDEERPISESLLLIESWESEVIVTTFIQLLHTVIGFKNRFLKKYHNIAGSIILLDEVQNIPVEYWPLINKVFKLLAEHLGCYIILLTATKPLIFDESEAIPLLDNYEDYFKSKGINRISLTPDMNVKSLTEMFREFKRRYDNSMSYLVVLNTIKSSIEFYKRLQADCLFEKLVTEGYLFYLSTNIIPKERGKRITKIKELLNQGQKIIVVSTQVVEAGIDIDMEVVVRDIGPIDSIIQVAGRCNRGMGENKGRVFVYNLADDNSSFARSVYGSTHFIVSRDLLGNKQLEEAEFFDLINRYFALIVQKKNQDSSAHIWDAIKNFGFYYQNSQTHSISDFELIKEKNGYVDVFIEIDRSAQNILTDYSKKVIKEKNFRKRQDNYLSIRKDIKSYIISVPGKLSVGLTGINADLLKVPYEQLQVFYEDDTGFKRTEDASFNF